MGLATSSSTLTQLDREYQTWLAGVRGQAEEGPTRRCGPTENDWADEPVARLILHIHRELIHHGAEVACLRDLCSHIQGRHGSGAISPPVPNTPILMQHPPLPRTPELWHAVHQANTGGWTRPVRRQTLGRPKRARAWAGTRAAYSGCLAM